MTRQQNPWPILLVILAGFPLTLAVIWAGSSNNPIARETASFVSGVGLVIWVGSVVWRVVHAQK